MFCNQCGHRNTDDSKFCTQCGAPLEQPETTTEQEYIPQSEFEYQQSTQESDASTTDTLVTRAAIFSGSIFYFMYFGLGLLQLAAVFSGIQEWWGWHPVAAFLTGLFVAYIPVVGQITGVMGAHDGWGWSWFWSIGLFIGPYIVLGILGTIFDRR
jgi:hypothetical protein